MIRKAIGLMIFAAGFAAGALLFLNKADAPLARAQMRVQDGVDFICTFNPPVYVRSDVSGDGLPNRFGVYYEMPICLELAGYQAVRAWFVDHQHFAISYEKIVY